MEALPKRFRTKINILENGCWLWTAALSEKGYGRVLVKGCNRYAHREVYKLYNGVIPDSYVVRHKCHNNSCVNPSHLIVGTHIDNIEDDINRGKTANTKISPEICRRFLLGELTTQEVKALTGARAKTISRLKTNSKRLIDKGGIL